MKQTRIVMGMPVEIEIVSVGRTMSHILEKTIEAAFAYLVEVDERFSTYKENSEISKINRGEIEESAMSAEMREVFQIAEKTKKETDGYFDIRQPSGLIDPSGIVKGWAILNTAKHIRDAGYDNYFINGAGDIAMGGTNAEGEDWSVGIRNPFNIQEIVKVVYPRGKGIATSGSYIRGRHIYNPHAPDDELRDIVSITVIGPDVLETDRFATAAFAMGQNGITFIETLPAFEAYAIDAKGVATITSGFGAYTK